MKKDARPCKQWFEIPLLAETYKVIVAWGDEERIREALMAWNFPEETDTSDWDKGKLGLTFSCDDCYPLIALHRSPETVEELGTLAHEAVHAVKRFFDHIHTPVTDDSEELFAQFVGAIVRQTMDKFAAIK